MYLRFFVCLFLLLSPLAASAEGLSVAPDRYGGFYMAGEKVVLAAQHAAGPVEYQVSDAHDAAVAQGDARADRDGRAEVTLDSRKLSGWYTISVQQAGQSATGSFVVVPRSRESTPAASSVFGAAVTPPQNPRQAEGMARSLRLAGVRSVEIVTGAGSDPEAFTEAALKEGLQIAPGHLNLAPSAPPLSPAKAYAKTLAQNGKQVLYYPWNQDGESSLISTDGSPRPSAIEYRSTADQLDGAKFVRQLKLDAGLTGFEFLRDGDRFVAAWSDTPGREADVKITSSSELIAVDSLGKPHSVPEDGASVTLHLTNQPMIFHGVDEDFWLVS